MESNDYIFKVNYKSEKYQTIFNNINKIFNGNYLNFISQIKLTHPYLVELFIILRKYQYFIHYIKIDKQILCLFDDKDKPILERILNIKQMMNKDKDNICSIKIELLPKFTKKEINFEIPNDTILLEININLRLTNEDNKINIEINKGTRITIKNLDGIIDKIILNEMNKILSQIFDLYIEETKEKNFKILNKFINYIENYLPTILPDSLKQKENKESDKNTEEDYWTQGEQTKFEELLIKYKSIKSLNERLKKISEEFKTKSLKQIKERYKSLASKVKNKKAEKANENINKENKIDNKDLEKKELQNEKDIKKESNKNEIKDNKMINSKDLTKENITNDKQQKDALKKEEEKDIKEKESKDNSKEDIKKEDKKEEEKEKNKKKKENEYKNKEKAKEEIKEDENEEEEEEKKIKEEDEEEEEEDESSIEKVEKNDIVEDLPSLDLNNKQISSKSLSSQSSNADNYKLYSSLDTTEDIIDAIIKVYNKNYKDHDLSLMQENSKDKNFSFYLNSLEENEESEENEEEESDKEEDKNGNNDNEKIKKKNDELIDLCLSPSFQPTISSEDLTLIKNILNFGDKYQVNLLDVQINNISIIQISHIKLLLKCSKCKKVAFESKYMKLNKQKNIFYLGTRCPRCQNEIFSIFISDFIHQNNLTNAGVCYITGGAVIEYLPSMYSLECEKCGQSKTIKLRTGCLHSNDSNCRKCNNKLNFVILSSSISTISISDLKDLADIKITNFEKYTFAIKDDVNLDNYVKKYDKLIQEGKELPDFGACKHYKYSLRWFRFGCCNKIFPCDLCHDETSDHNCEFAKTILCGYCAHEQSSNNKVCSKCGKIFTKSAGAKKFWEGGKGCRNPLFMGARDKHKFTGLNKTISRKKQREMQSNNKNKK